MYDTSRLPGEFSLKKLSEIYHSEIIRIRKYYLDFYKKKYENDEKILTNLIEYEKFNEGDAKKIDMKTLFQSKKIFWNLLIFQFSKKCTILNLTYSH